MDIRSSVYLIPFLVPLSPILPNSPLAHALAKLRFFAHFSGVILGCMVCDAIQEYIRLLLLPYELPPGSRFSL